MTDHKALSAFEQVALLDGVERLNALVAMQAEALGSVNTYLVPRVANSGITGRTVILPLVEQALSASAETVAAWTKEQRIKALDGIVDIVGEQHGRHSGLFRWVKIWGNELRASIKGE